MARDHQWPGSSCCQPGPSGGLPAVGRVHKESLSGHREDRKEWSPAGVSLTETKLQWEWKNAHQIPSVEVFKFWCKAQILPSASAAFQAAMMTSAFLSVTCPAPYSGRFVWFPCVYRWPNVWKMEPFCSVPLSSSQEPSFLTTHDDRVSSWCNETSEDELKKLQGFEG